MSAKFLGSTGLTQLVTLIKNILTSKADSADGSGGVAKRTAAIPFGQVDSTSTSTVFTATVPGITELHNGVCVFLMNGVVTSASGFTININDLGAKPVYGTLAAATRATTLFNINYTLFLVYNEDRISGGCWDAYYGYDSNTNTIGYQLRTNSTTMPTLDKFYRYRLLFTAADQKHFVPANTSSFTNATASRAVNQRPIDPFGAIYYYGHTTAINANANPTASYFWTQYSFNLGYSFNRSGAALTLTSYAPVYIKCAPQSDGSAIIDADNPFVQALPSTADGKIYIFLGIASGAEIVELVPVHPIYCYRNGAIRLWVGPLEKELPSVTEADNGKVLGVVNGAWAVTSNSGERGPTAIVPAYLDEDVVRYVDDHGTHYADDVYTSLLMQTDISDGIIPFVLRSIESDNTEEYFELDCKVTKASPVIYFRSKEHLLAVDNNGHFTLTDRPQSGASVTVDSVLSDTSENPVQNKVVKAALDEKADAYKLNALATFTDSGETVVPLFVNQLPISIDTDGTIYNNGSGWIDGYRIKSDGTLEALSNAGTTGFIPINNTKNAILRFSGMNLIADPEETSTGSGIWYYDSTFTKIGGAQTKNLVIAETNSDGYVSKIDLSQQTVSGRIPPDNTAFFRVCAYRMNSDSIITINEEIEYGKGVINHVTINSEVEIPQIAELKDSIDALATFTEETGRVPLFTNQLPISTDMDNTIFHDIGYHEGYRFNSSGEEVAATGVSTTGFIPCVRTAVLRFQDITFYASATGIPSGRSANYCYIIYYDNNKTMLGRQQLREIYDIVPAALTVVDNLITALDLSATLSTPSRDAPEGTAYVRFSAYDVSPNSIITVNEEIAYNEHGGITSATLKSNVGIPQLTPLDVRITALEEESGSATDSTNPLIKYAKQIDNGLTVGYEPTLTGRSTADLVAKKYLNFLHISDTHGSVNAENAIKILNKLKTDGRCSFLIHTGDFHASTFADVASWNTFAGYIAQATAPVFLVSGNHDVGNNSQSTTDGTTATDAQLYARCFEPYVSGWNLTSHPDSKCYWYKDFADENVRLIGLYDFESDYATDSTTGNLLYKRGYAAYHQAQIDWLVQALLSCPAGYGVIIAKHNPMNKRGTLDNPFNGEFLQGQNTAQSYVSKDMIAEIVQAFMDGTTINKTFTQTGNVTDTLTVNQNFSGKNTGAHFICYLNGHTHADGVNFLADFPKQLELNIGCDNYHYQHYADTYNQQGTLHQDLLNYVSVDVNRGYIYIQRIGNDYTAQADRRDFTAIDYKNPPVDVDFPEVDASDDGKVWGVSGGQYGLIASPAPTVPALESILTYTCDGTETSSTYFTTDDNGDAYRLKRAVLRVTLGAVSAAGTFSADLMSGASKRIGQCYAAYSASSTGYKYLCVAELDGGYWTQRQTNWSKGIGTENLQVGYSYVDAEADYPYIDRVRLTRAVPTGTVIELLGVRA